jgi:hypothetical protein
LLVAVERWFDCVDELMRFAGGQRFSTQHPGWMICVTSAIMSVSTHAPNGRSTTGGMTSGSAAKFKYVASSIGNHSLFQSIDSRIALMGAGDGVLMRV